MRRNILQRMAEYLARNRRHRIWKKIVSVLACIAVFCTTYAMILPAITMERTAYCGIEPHQHSEECFESTLICGIEETEPTVHTHSETCVVKTQQLICENDDPAHTHTEECYETTLAYVCGYEEGEEIPGHTHGAECYEQVLVCEKQEHDHTSDCYVNPETAAETDGETTESQTSGESQEADDSQVSGGSQEADDSQVPGESQETGERQEVETAYCGIEPHRHGEACFEKTLICEETETEQTAHVHTEECYEQILICEKQEHNHTFACYSDPEADVETAEIWESSVSQVELTGDWRADLIAVAESQLGYTGSTQNYAVADDGVTVRGYTRYGAWYGEPYGEWDAMFVSFCLHYADIPAENLPQESDCFRWAGILQSEDWGLYREKETYTPVMGDLVFFDWDGDGVSDHVGLVAEMIAAAEDEAEESVAEENVAEENVAEENTTATEESTNAAEDSVAVMIRVIEGDSENQVRDAVYPIDDETILGYAELPEKEKTTQTCVGADYTVTVAYGPEAGLPEDAQLTVRELIGEEYEDACQAAEETLGVEGLYFARFFDVSFAAGGEKLEPAAPVDVRISYPSIEMEEGLAAGAVHFTADGMEVLEAELEQTDDGTAFMFTQDSFSVVGTILGRVDVPSMFADGELGGGVFENTLSPASSVINVFDYWTNGRFPYGGDATDYYSSGINNGHNLKFRNNNINGFGTCNIYNSTGLQVTQGIVANTLGADGYPRLSGNATIVKSSEESLAYLFDPDRENVNGRKAFKAVQGLFYDRNGYYTYDSTEHYAYLNEGNRNLTATETGNEFTLYQNWGVGDNPNGNQGQFFPFNAYPAPQNIGAGKMSHYFGLTLTARFIQQYGGHTNASGTTPMVFNFSGDDDVWIFIDDVLVADLGGIHGKVSTSIDFSTGKVEIWKKYSETNISRQETTIKAQFVAAGLGDTEAWNNDTFADNTTHTLKFFYLERGNNESNMSLQYNLNEIPPTAIYKVNQYGTPVAGAEFEVYQCDTNWNASGSAVYSGVTNTEGEMVFVDPESDSPYALDDMRKLFGNQFILRETKVPSGYRLVAEDIHLRIQNGALVCDNTYESGVWATPTVQVAAPNTLTIVDNTTRTYHTSPTLDQPNGTTNGTLFAVVLKYIGPVNDDGTVTLENLAKPENWGVVSGNPKDGYTVDQSANGDAAKFVEAVINAARSFESGGENPTVFTLSNSSGGMEAQLENLPGKVVNYYHMLTDKTQTQYTIGYYWTSATTLAGANSANTFRVNAEDDTNRFYRTFGANIEVPNLANRLLVQKYDEDKNLVNGATFGLFKVNESGAYLADDNTTYVSLADKTYVAGVSEADLKANQYTITATAPVMNADGTVVNGAGGTGVIWVNDGGTTRSITPYETRTTNSAVLEGSPGTCVFGIWGTDLTPGCYYLREMYAPDGYKLNLTPVMVRVTEDTIYANAGTADDGITVSRGPGYIVSTLHKAASAGDIDRTLSWIYQQLRVLTKDTYSFTDVSMTDTSTWDFIKNGDNILTSYLEYTRSAASLGATRYLANYTPRENTDSTQKLSTDVGWSYNEIYQDYSYGVTQKGSANYTEINGPITNLFSRTVYVEVTDEKISDLEISKTVTGASTGSDQKFTFTVTVEGAEGGYDYAIYNGTDRTTPTESGTLMFDSEKQTATVTLKHNQTVVIKDLPGGAAYTVTEAKVDRYYPSYSIDGGESTEGLTASGVLKWGTVTVDNEGSTESRFENVSKVAFTNTYIEWLSLTLQKYETATTEPLSGAKFVLYRTEKEETAGGEAKDVKQYYHQKSDNTVEWVALSDPVKLNDLALATDGAGKLVFTAIPDGTYYLEEVQAPDGYMLPDEPISFTVDHGKVKVGPSGNYTDDTITVYNSLGIELPETGGIGIGLFTAGGLLLMAASVCLEYSQRRRHERGMGS